MFEASAPLAAASWELASELQASTQACTGLDWQQPSPGLPPLLVVGTAADGAQVWMYREQLMRWEQAATLGSPQVRHGSQNASACRQVLSNPAHRLQQWLVGCPTVAC